MHRFEQQCQTKTLKRNKIDRIIEEEEDRLSLLPDCLLIEILSRLPTTEEAIKTCILAKRWQHLWPLVHNLIFIDHRGLPIKKKGGREAFHTFVEQTLAQCCHLKLYRFKLVMYFLNMFESLVKNWIRGAINLNVQELDISLQSHSKFGDLLVFDYELFFINSNFKHLRLSCSEFNPTGAISWKNLKSLCIRRGKLDEGLIQNMLSGSPLLETFGLLDCYGFRRINITSKSVKHLVCKNSRNSPRDKFEGGEKIMEIDAPNILTLTIEYELPWKLVLLHVSSLVEAYLDYYILPAVEEQERLKELILCLRHVKELKLGFLCSAILCRLEAKGFGCQSNVVKWTGSWSMRGL